jgi:hypothetical protein
LHIEMVTVFTIDIVVGKLKPEKFAALLLAIIGFAMSTCNVAVWCNEA